NFFLLTSTHAKNSNIRVDPVACGLILRWANLWDSNPKGKAEIGRRRDFTVVDQYSALRPGVPGSPVPRIRQSNRQFFAAFFCSNMSVFTSARTSRGSSVPEL